MKYGFIGFGNLAQAIYQGLKINPEIEFACFDPGTKAELSTGQVKQIENIKDLVAFSDVVWLCIKPQNLGEVLEELKNLNLEGKTLVSPVAGQSIGSIEKILGKKVAIVRIMPNLAIAYGKSVTAYYTNDKNNQLAEKIKEDLSKLGKVVELPEDKFDLFTAIFGSGPAFLLEVLKVFKEKIEELGIEKDKAKELLVELSLGTTAYLKENKNEIGELIEKITSKGGVTEAGLKTFKENNLTQLLKEVLISAEKKSQEMGK
jgi:pyrroline-5-carboxylate reductase